jgi:hypothetical protein
MTTLADVHSKGLILSQSQVAQDTELTKEIQVLLAKLGWYPHTMLDGLWGKVTESCISQFCESVNLDNAKTKKYGPTFAKALLNAKPAQNKYLNPADFSQAASFLQVEIAAIRAVVDVEAAGGGFFKDGRPKILFEAHHFNTFTKGVFRHSHPSLSSPRWNRSLYLGGPREYERLAKAQALNNWAALMSTSWGLGQIMGFNYPVCGYPTVEAFVAAMYESEGKQLLAMCSFIRNRGLDKALKRHDWATFARGYNGPAFAQNAYDRKLASAYRSHLS